MYQNINQNSLFDLEIYSNIQNVKKKKILNIFF